MQDNRPQKEFFEFEKPKKRAFRLPRIFLRPDLDGNFTLSLGMEKLLFISIALIMLAVIIYALGVERGKALGRKADIYVEAPRAERTALPAKEAAQISDGAVASRPSVTVRAAANKAVAEIAAAERSAAAISYAIVTATFRSKDGAARLEAELRKEGYDARTADSGQYFQVLVGSFVDKNGADAQNQLRRIKKRFKDAYIRML